MKKRRISFIYSSLINFIPYEKNILLSYCLIILLWQKEKLKYLSILDHSAKSNDLKEEIKNLPRYYAINNLNFIPNIKFRADSIFYKGDKIPYFNQAGYRGDIIPLEKDSNKNRILFLGGSTTFQEGGNSLESTFPEQVKIQLKEQHQYHAEKIEILNGALDGANSFDILNAYLYKYKYYQPDILIIHSGFNDCAWYADSIYSPDYTHLKLSLAVDNAGKFVKKIAVFLLNFKFTSNLVFYYTNLRRSKSQDIIKQATKQRANYPKWKVIQSESALSDSQYNAFYNNIKTLVQISKLNHTFPILVQMPYPQEHEYFHGIFGKAIRAHNVFLEKVSQEENIPIVRIQDISLSSKNFIDPIHVDSIGNSLKGQAVAKTIFENFQLK